MGELGMMYGSHYDEYMDHGDVPEDEEYKTEMRMSHCRNARTHKNFDEYYQAFDESDYTE